ncbi:hypothetical protein MTBLM5_10207 [Magnetospirillum sp. LM-5]|uniref:hypothetical protein n=1 Tax=Magnetospirillum sp. LM-5 TaxID=2681466 RepID=UPI0013841118|nr:hypothetical protein [Magnetospirillum sp. LM-5]CAA7611825.1 hypothetical protein MTBLM5_10207 [Magnetospirillum sp. LM-5]
MRLRVRLRLGAWLVLLTAFAALPLIAFSGYAVYQLGLSQSKATAILLTQRTEATANAVAERLSAALGGLHALAQSDTARKGDVAALAEFARRVRPLYPEVLAINMVRSDGEMIFHTSRPFGEKLPPTADRRHRLGRPRHRHRPAGHFRAVHGGGV